MYLFAYLVKTVPGGIYPFDDIGLSLIAIPKNSKPPYTNQKQFDTQFFLKDSKGVLVLDANGFPQSAPAESVIGDPNPDWLAAISNTIRWKRY